MILSTLIIITLVILLVIAGVYALLLYRRLHTATLRAELAEQHEAEARCHAEEYLSRILEGPGDPRQPAVPPLGVARGPATVVPIGVATREATVLPLSDPATDLMNHLNPLGFLSPISPLSPLYQTELAAIPAPDLPSTAHNHAHSAPEVSQSSHDSTVYSAPDTSSWGSSDSGSSTDTSTSSSGSEW